jgi:hypothetical protein
MTPEEYRLIELTLSPREILAQHAPRTLYELSAEFATNNPDVQSAFAAWAAWVPEDTSARDTGLFIACVEALRVHLARHGQELPRRLRKRIAALVAITEPSTVRACAYLLRRLRDSDGLCSNTGLGGVLNSLMGEVIYVDDQSYSVSPLRLVGVTGNMRYYDPRLLAYAFMSCLRVYNGDLRAKNLWGSESEPAAPAQAWYRLQRVMWPEPTLLDQSQMQALSGSAV